MRILLSLYVNHTGRSPRWFGRFAGFILASPFNERNETVHILGIDLGKNWFHIAGLDPHGKPVFRKKLNRTQLSALAATHPPCIIAMESCPGSQFWGRVFARYGHTLRILPAQFVKPYLKSNKNDFNNAEAIAEAATQWHSHICKHKLVFSKFIIA